MEANADSKSSGGVEGRDPIRGTAATQERSNSLKAAGFLAPRCHAEKYLRAGEPNER
jgi:hypothetical protein